MSGLDFSNFKKTAQDKKSATLVHPDGHEIRVAIGNLKPDLKKKLMALPLHQAEPEGPVETMDEDSPAPATDEPATPPTQPAAPVAAGPAPTPAVAPIAGGSAGNGTMPEPVPAPVPVVPPLPAPNSKEDLDQQAAHLQQDFNNGHITPKTYQGLYANKDTMGKIGTFFGLLMSGAGSGLTGQPNALLEMMNKEIDRDLEAQKASQTAAHNWLSLAQQHELQKAQVQKMGTEQQLIQAQIAKMPAETREAEARAKLHEVEATKAPAQIKEMEARAQQSRAESGLIAMNTAKTGMMLSMVKEMQNTVDKMPEGPQKQQGLAVLNNTVAPAVQAKIEQDNAKTAGVVQISNAAKEAQQREAIKNDSGINIDRFNNLVKTGRAEEGLLGFTGKGLSSSEAAKATEEAKKVQENRSIAKIYSDSFKKLDTLSAGKLTPAMRAAEINALGAQVARATAGRYSAPEAAAQASGMFPDVGDKKSTREEKYRKAMDYFQSEESGTTTLDRFKLKTPFPFSGSEGEGKMPSSGVTQAQAPVEKTTPNGKIGLFDPATKKFLGYKGESDKSAVAATGTK